MWLGSKNIKDDLFWDHVWERGNWFGSLQWKKSRHYDRTQTFASGEKEFYGKNSEHDPEIFEIITWSGNWSYMKTQY